MSRPRFWHRIRFKLLLVSLTLLGIPLAGYRFIQETEQFLRDAQDQALQTTAGSVANIMHSHEEAFHGVARPGSVLTFRNLFLHQLDKAPQVDGYRDEWVHYDDNFTQIGSLDGSLEARIFLGQHERHLYLLIGVRDPKVDYGGDGDSVELAMLDADGTLQRYRIQPHAPGWVTAKPLSDDDEPDDDVPIDADISVDSNTLIDSNTAVDSNIPADSLIRGEWQSDAHGYTVELRIPRDEFGGRLSLRFQDSHGKQLLASGHMFPAESLGRVVERAPQLETALEDVTPPATRIWITDHQGLVLAQSGRLDANAPLSADQQRMPWFIQELILAVLPRDAETIADLSADQTHLFVRPVVDALSGRPTSMRRKPPRSNAIVVSAAVPIRSSAGVRGAVLVEQTTNAILLIQNLALQRLFGVTLLFFAVTSLGLLMFASLLASRITRLRDRVEDAVGHDGRIVGTLEGDDAKDEIGDLGRSFASVLDRLHEYNHYLEAMAARLAHELRTPLAVVRSSLDNADQAEPNERDIYLRRARQGAERLERILQRLREATGLEQAMRQAERVQFNLAELLRAQVAALGDNDPNARITLHGAEQAIPLTGVPDLVSQAFDKLINNAVEFHAPGSTITVTCDLDPRAVKLSVANVGPPLPADVDVFQSMVSVRPGKPDQPHLGLGLYLVRLIAEFHGGTVSATDHDGSVAVTLELPRDA